MDQCDLDQCDLDQCDLEFEFEDFEASYAADQASCSAHYWCARRHFLNTQAIYPEIDLSF